jgi:hypothetical protein
MPDAGARAMETVGFVTIDSGKRDACNFAAELVFDILGI